MILIDTNVFLYAAGKPSPQREPCRRFLDQVVQGDPDLDARTDAEVLQEILHRYRTTREAGKGTALFDAVLDLGIPVLSVTEAGLRHARRLVEQSAHLSTRDAVHVGVMVEHGISRVLSYDRGFDGLAGIERVQP